MGYIMRFKIVERLNSADFFSLWTFRTRAWGELNLITLVEGIEFNTFKVLSVEEQVITTLLRDEAESLPRHDLFNSACFDVAV